MTDTAESLDPLRLPLQGERLIEASAGTGKTFTIAALYLRLLLGLGGQAAFPRPLSVEELLVVTFTEAATAELRGRIRANIHELRIACLRESTDNPLYASLLEEIADKQQAAQWLLLAERQMDEASVFTIHGFCQRMLSLNAFESGMLFELQLIEDESELRYQACADFWRRHCYPLQREIAEAVHALWKGPEELLRAIERYLQGEAPVIKSPPPADETLASRHEKSSRRLQPLSKNGLSLSARSTPLSKTPGSTGASLTVAIRGNGSIRSLPGRRKRRAVTSSRMRWKNFPGVFWLSEPKPMALFRSTRCLLRLKPCWQSH